MAQITTQSKTFHCPEGANRRQVLLAHRIPVHNGNAALINCQGLGTGGTYAVEIQGQVSLPSWREQTRLSLPPHPFKPQQNKRLANQVAGIN